MKTKIKAIFADYDGTLCPAAGLRSNDGTFIPSQLGEILWSLSERLPICIISSKDSHFLIKRTPFATALSCIMGIETLVTKSNNGAPRQIDKRRLCIHRIKLVENARKLESISKTIQSEFPSVMVEKKQTYDELLAGITIDWRKMKDWNRPRKAIEARVMDTASSHKSSSPLYVKAYSSHPFIDIYAAKCDKAVGFKSVLVEAKIKGEGKIMYLGDSENDNPAFALADISIGIRSDPRLQPRLECDFALEYDSLASFLQRLLDNDMIFSDDVVKMLGLRNS